MENAILSDDKIPVSLLTNDTVTSDDINDLCIEQSRHLLKILKEPCTEHYGGIAMIDDSVRDIREGEDFKFKHGPARMYCSNCMKQIEKEINQ